MIEIVADIIYNHCVAKFGMKKPPEKPTFRRNKSRQKEMENLERKRNL